MKFNINFDWAVITSIFTLFLYWCGYWYFLGFAQFYNFEIDAFDLPVAPLILAGLMVGIKYVVYLLITLMTLSFLFSVDNKQWNYWFLKSLTIIFNIYLLFYYLIQHLSKKSTNSLSGLIKFRLKVFFDWLRPKVRGCVRLDILLGLKVERFLKRRNLTPTELKKSILGDSYQDKPSNYEFSILIHYSLIIVLLFGLSTLFSIGKNQSEAGYKAAEKQFSSYSKMNKVVIENEDDLRSTKLCFKGFCLLTDKDKNVRIAEMKDVKVLNNPVDDNKKAPLFR